MRAILIVVSILVEGAVASAAAQTASPAAPAPSAKTAPAAAATTTPTPAPTPTAAAPSPAASAPAVAADPAPTAFEKQLLAKGYKPAMNGDQKVYCHTEVPLGSRLGGHKVCATADQLAAEMHNAQELTERTQKMPVPTLQ